MNKIDLQHSFCEKIDESIIYVHVNVDADIDVKQILQIRTANEQLAGGKNYLVLFEIGNFAIISKEARELGATKDYGKNRKAMALIVNSIAHRLLANFFINVNKPPTPTKVFNDKEKALEWLNQFKKTL